MAGRGRWQPDWFRATDALKRTGPDGEIVPLGPSSGAGTGLVRRTIAAASASPAEPDGEVEIT